MKKSIIAAGAVLCVLIIGVVAFFSLRGGEKPEISEAEQEMLYIEYQKEKEKIFDLLKIEDGDILKNKAEELEVSVQYTEDGSVFSVYGLTVSGSEMSLYFQYGDDGKITVTEGNVTIKDVTDTYSLQVAIAHSLSFVSEFFGIQPFEAYDVFSPDGAKLISSEEVTEKILEGYAEFAVSALDRDNTFWRMTGSVNKDEELQLKFFHSFEIGLYEVSAEDVNFDVKNCEPKQYSNEIADMPFFELPEGEVKKGSEDAQKETQRAELPRSE